MDRILCLILFILIGFSVSTVQAQDSLYHVVQKGETLSEISLIYNKRIDRILRDNQLQTELLEIGDSLLIILPAKSTYLLSLKNGKISESKNNNIDTEESIQKSNSVAKKSFEQEDSIQNKDQEINETKVSKTDSSTNKESLYQPNVVESQIDEKSGILDRISSLYKKITISILSYNYGSKLAHYVILTNLVLLFFTLIMLIIGFFSRVFKVFRDKKQKRYSEFFENVLTHFLFSTEDELDDEAGLSLRYFKEERIAKTRRERSWLIKLFIQLHNDLVGESEEHLKSLFLMHRLDKDVERNLKSKRWYVKAKAIHEIGNMELGNFADEVKVNTKNQNKEVVFKSILTLIQLDKKNPLAFLSYLEIPLTEWQQIQLFYALGSLDETKISFDKNWLKSKNDSVVIFAIRFCIRYNRHEFIGLIKKNLENPNPLVQIEVINAIRALGNESNIELLKSKMSTRFSEKKQALIKAISLLQMEPDSLFFQNIIRQSDYNTALIAAKAFYSIPSGIEVLERMKLDENEPEMVRSIVTHALDRRL